jgi:MFS family permease
MNAARHNPRFRRLLAGLAISQAGDWLYNLALLAFVYERTHSSVWVGLTTAARVLPILICGPLGGVVADRYDRRRIMLASDAVRVALMLALALVAVAGLPVVLAPAIAALATVAASAYPPSVAASATSRTRPSRGHRTPASARRRRPTRRSRRRPAPVPARRRRCRH